MTDEKDIEELLEIIGEEQITGWQLKDILDENKNYDIIKKKLRNKVTQNQLITQGKIKEDNDEDKAEKEKDDKDKKDFPKENIEAMLKSIGLAECIAKMKEAHKHIKNHNSYYFQAEIAEPDVFFDLDEGTVMTCLGIETQGKQFRFKEKLKEVKEKHEKLKAKKEHDEMSEIIGETFEKLQKKLSVVF